MKNLAIKKMNGGIYALAFVTIGVAVLMSAMVIMFEIGILHPRKTELTIETESREKYYDGAPLIGEGFDIVYGKLSDGHSVKIIGATRQTEVGRAKNVLDITVVDSVGADVTELYDIEQRYGTLTVSKRKVEMQFDSVQKYYDGTPLSAESWVRQGSVDFVNGHTVSISSMPSITEVGDVENVGDVKIINASGVDVTKYYELEIKPGKLSVLPRSLVISTGTAQKSYDEKPIHSDEWELLKGQLYEGHRLEVKCTSEISLVGEVDNEAMVTVFDSMGLDITAQYDVQLEKGKLKIDPRPLYITTVGSSKIYDGQPLTSKQWYLSGGEVCSGHRMSVSCDTEITQVGEVSNVPTVTVYNAEGVDVSDQYGVVKNMGKLTVTPKTIYITTGGMERVYDGTPLVNRSYRITSGELNSGDYIELVSTPSLTNIGEMRNEFLFVVRDSYGKDVSAQYNITQISGVLKVYPRQISVLTSDAIKKYDGKVLGQNKVSLIEGSLCAGHTMTFVGSRRIEVGISENVPISFSIKDAKGIDVSKCYQVTFSYGRLTVTP